MDFQTACWVIVALTAPVGILLNMHLVIDTLVGDDD